MGLVSRVTSVVLSTVIVVGCTASNGVVRVQWEVVEESRTTDPFSRSAVVQPIRFSGVETWWLLPGAVLIEAIGNAHGGERGHAITLIEPSAGWVYQWDRLADEFLATPITLWEELSLRRSRSAYLQALHQATGSPEIAEYFQGSQRLEVVSARGGRSRAIFPVTAGRLWRLGRRLEHAAPWTEPAHVLGFAAVGMAEAKGVLSTLARRNPRVIEEITLASSTGQDSMVTRSVRGVRNSEPREDFMSTWRARLSEWQVEEQSLQSFRTLWGFVEDPQSAPLHLDDLQIRARLEQTAEPLQLPVVRDRILTSEDPDERENLLHVIYSVDSDLFSQWWNDAVSRGDLALIVEMTSVASLRRSPLFRAQASSLLAEESPLWIGRPPAEVQGVKNWISALISWSTALDRLPALPPQWNPNKPEPDPQSPVEATP